MPGIFSPFKPVISHNSLISASLPTDRPNLDTVCAHRVVIPVSGVRACNVELAHALGFYLPQLAGKHLTRNNTGDEHITCASQHSKCNNFVSLFMLVLDAKHQTRCRDRVLLHSQLPYMPNTASASHEALLDLGFLLSRSLPYRPQVQPKTDELTVHQVRTAVIYRQESTPKVAHNAQLGNEQVPARCFPPSFGICT